MREPIRKKFMYDGKEVTYEQYKAIACDEYKNYAMDLIYKYADEITASDKPVYGFSITIISDVPNTRYCVIDSSDKLVCTRLMRSLEYAIEDIREEREECDG